MMTFLELNEELVKCTDAEMVQLGLGVADGTMKQADVYLWIAEHIED